MSSPTDWVRKLPPDLMTMATNQGKTNTISQAKPATGRNDQSQKPRKTLIRPHKCVLDDLFGLLALANQPQCQRKCSVFVAIHKNGKRPRVSGTDIVNNPLVSFE